jgi:hypothetical protein
VPKCPWCTTPISAAAIQLLEPGRVHAFYDASAVNARAKYLATAVAVIAQLGATGYDRFHACVAVYKLLSTLVEGVQGATTRAVALMALTDYRNAVVHVRRHVFSLVPLLGERRLQQTVDIIADVMMRHAADVAVQRAAVDAMFSTAVVASRKPQQAIAAALAIHGADHVIAYPLCVAAVRYTYKRLSSSGQVRSIGLHLANALVVHAHDQPHVSMYALGALCNVAPRLSPAELVELRAVKGLVQAALSICDSYEGKKGQDMFIKCSRAVVHYIECQPRTPVQPAPQPAKRARIV